MSKVKIGKEVFATQNRAVTICRSAVDDESCYAVIHQPTGHVELFDDDAKILKTVKDKINRVGGLVLDRKATGGILKFPKGKRERSITLRLFLCAKYEGLKPGEVKGSKVSLVDSSLKQENINDLRSENLYLAGESRAKNARREITIMQNPLDLEEKIMHIRMVKVGLDAYTPYTPELYEMLSSTRYCGISVNKSKTRITVIVHHSHKKDGYKIVNLARFLCIYKNHFASYQNQRGAIKRFIHDFEKLNALYEGLDASHLNALKFDNSFNNIMLMNEKTNKAMDEFARYFIGDYALFPTLNDDNEILVAFMYFGRAAYFLCRTPDDYADLQKLLLGKELTGHLQEIKTGAGAHKLTPCGMIEVGAAGKKKKESPGTSPGAYLNLMNRRKELLALPQEHFFRYDKDDIRTPEGFCSIIAALCGVPRDSIVIRVSPLDKKET